MKTDIEIIRWVDIKSYTNSSDSEEHENVVFNTVGAVREYTYACIKMYRIYTTFMNDYSECDFIDIPKGAVISRKLLKEVEI